MMSVRQHHGRILPPNHPTSTQGTRSKPSRLVALQADLQSKIMKEKEEKLLRQINNGESRRQKTLDRYKNADDRQDSSSAPGGVRSFFQERNKKLVQVNSAGSINYQSRKREGYDKSRPLEPLSHNHQNSGLPTRRLVDQTTLSSSKNAIFSALKRTAYLRDSRNYHNTLHAEKKAAASDFEKWRVEQDTMDRQRRLNAVNRNGNAAQHSTLYSPNHGEDSHMEAELERRAVEARELEAEKQKRALIKQKQEEKRREQAERGRRRKEESERRQRELALDLQRQKEAEQDDEEQAEMIRQLEEKLKEKQKDLENIKSRKPKERDLESPDSYQPPSSRTETKAKQSSRQLQSSQLSQHQQSEEPTQAFPVKPRKVVRKEANTKVKPKESPSTYADKYPSKGDGSPIKSHSRTKSNELNTTYKVSRESSMPINVVNEQPEPFITDGAGLDIELSPCAVCGRNFATDRLAKHQHACKKVSKPRKKFDVTSQRIAGSGAEKFQYKVKQHTKNPSKPNKKDWRAQHEEFIANIRYAKMAAAVEAKGGNVASLPPPPKSENLDYVQCPHCSRKYNQTAAERHIPKCKDIKARPSMLKKGSRR